MDPRIRIHPKMSWIRNTAENDRYWQKNNFLLFEKCLKMYSFFRILRLQKVLLWPQKNFSLKISIWVWKKRRILCWFQIRWWRLKQMHLKKVRAKYFRFCAFFRGCLLLTFVRGISESQHQRIWNQNKILPFFDTQLKFGGFFSILPKTFLMVLKFVCILKRLWCAHKGSWTTTDFIL